MNLIKACPWEARFKSTKEVLVATLTRTEIAFSNIKMLRPHNSPNITNLMKLVRKVPSTI